MIIIYNLKIKNLTLFKSKIIIKEKDILLF